VFARVDRATAQADPATLARLCALERRLCEWRWRSRGKERRVCAVHGALSPASILFDDVDEIAVLGAEANARGEPAEDAVAIALPYLLAAGEHAAVRRGGLAELWLRFWTVYLRLTRDLELLDMAPFYVARGILAAIPPAEGVRAGAPIDALLAFAEQSLAAGTLDPERALEVLR
jgi:hypothetical protein